VKVTENQQQSSGQSLSEQTKCVSQIGVCGCVWGGEGRGGLKRGSSLFFNLKGGESGIRRRELNRRWAN